MGWRDAVKHFSPSGDPALGDPTGERMDLELMQRLDAMRGEVGLPFVITDGFRQQADQERLLAANLTETNAGAHPLGKAVDGYFVGLPLLAMFSYACRWEWAGIGLYPYAMLALDRPQPVIHLDVMDRGKSRTALWIRNRARLYVYAPSAGFVHELQMLVVEETWKR